LNTQSGQLRLTHFFGEMNMMDLIPPILLLLIASIFTLVILFKLKGEQILKLLRKPSVASISGALFFFLLVVHLFAPQDWIVDLLKVIAGVLAGTYAAGIDKSINQKAIGDNIQQAARDINNIKSNLSKIENSVIEMTEPQKSADDSSVILFRDTEHININFEENTIARKEYEAMREEFPSYFELRVTEFDKTSELHNRQIYQLRNRQVEFFENLPEAKKLLKNKIYEIQKIGWEVDEVNFDYSSSSLVIIITTIRRVKLSEIEHDD